LLETSFCHRYAISEQASLSDSQGIFPAQTKRIPGAFQSTFLIF